MLGAIERRYFTKSTMIETGFPPALISNGGRRETGMPSSGKSRFTNVLLEM